MCGRGASCKLSALIPSGVYFKIPKNPLGLAVRYSQRQRRAFWRAVSLPDGYSRKDPCSFGRLIDKVKECGFFCREHLSSHTRKATGYSFFELPARQALLASNPILQEAFQKNTSRIRVTSVSTCILFFELSPPATGCLLTSSNP